MRVETERMYLYPLSDEEIRTITEWALSQECVQQVEAETDERNVASQNVLFRSGFVSNGKMGEEGLRFVYGGRK